MVGELSVAVQSVTSSPMSTGNCVDEMCAQALGFVTCKVTGGKQLLLAEEPLANSYYAVGTADGGSVVVPCDDTVQKGQTMTVCANFPAMYISIEVPVWVCFPFSESSRCYR